MNYQKLFEPGNIQKFAATTAGVEPAGGDRRDGSVYVYTDEIILAVNVALATRRPLLIGGPSGTGKSTLAQNVARTQGWRYYEEVVTSRTQARDLLWSFDTLRRLNDAQTLKREDLRPASEYVRPGVLWWAFDPQSARSRSDQPEVGSGTLLEDPGLRFLAGPAASTPPVGAVVLVDEIDKADPDVPNNLLVPLGSMEFEVMEAGARPFRVRSRAQLHQGPLVIITTNNERELPAAFLRRCIILKLEPPTRERLIQIAVAQLGEAHRGLAGAVADRLLRNAAEVASEPPSTAEYLDALRTCRDLHVVPDDASTVWNHVRRLTLHKDRSAVQAAQ